VWAEAAAILVILSDTPVSVGLYPHTARAIGTELQECCEAGRAEIVVCSKVLHNSTDKPFLMREFNAALNPGTYRMTCYTVNMNLELGKAQSKVVLTYCAQ
jgi:hypothetical protein